MLARRGLVLLVVALASILTAVYVCTLGRQQQSFSQIQSLLESQGEAAAVPVLDSFLEENPHHARALLIRAQIHRDHGETASALECLERIESSDAQDIAMARFLQSGILMDQGDVLSGEQMLLEAIRLHTDNTLYRSRLIPLYCLQRRPLDVREQLSKIQEQRQLSLSELALWVTADGRLTEHEVAMPMLTRYCETRADDLPSLLALSRYQTEERHIDDAVSRLQQALKTHPRHSRIAYQLAEFLLLSNQVEAAQQILRQHPLTTLSTVEDWKVAGNLAFELRDWKHAELALKYAVARTPFDRNAVYKYSRALEELGHKADAGLWRNRAVLLNELHADVETIGVMMMRNQLQAEQLLKIARLLDQIDQRKLAKQWAREALTLKPGWQDALSLLSLTEPSSYAETRIEPPLAAWNSLPEMKLDGRSQSTGGHQVVQEAPIHLEEVAQQSGLSFQYENGHTGKKYLIETMGAAVGVIDFDRDQWPDLYCPQGGGLGDGPSRPPLSDQIFRNQGNSQFENRTLSTGVNELGYSQGCAVGDIDNDGFDDLVVANVGRDAILRNLGDGTFEDVTEPAGYAETTGMSSSVALADLDGDGDLDIYLVNYVDTLRICRNDKGEISTCNPSSHEAAEDQLFENRGDGTFVEVSVSAGITAPRGKGLGVVVAHLDDDTKPDIFITNDTTPNFLYQNQSEPGALRFSETGQLAGVAVNSEGVAEAGMGIACADLDQNGMNDLYVTNFYLEANTLNLQLTPGVFEDSTSRAGLREPTLPLLGFGAQAVDFDLDTWDELYVTNGHIDDQGSLGVPWKMPPQLFRTNSGTQWVEVKDTVGDYLRQPALGRGVARWDPDRNGLPDIVIGHQDRPVASLRNTTPTTGRFITLRLVGTKSNRSAVNAIVRWSVQGRERLAEVCGGDGYLCSNERLCLIGLGPADSVDWIEVVWPSGQRDRQTEIKSNHRWVQVEAGPLLADEDLMTGSAGL